jgi:hypothetical protein
MNNPSNKHAGMNACDMNPAMSAAPLQPQAEVQAHPAPQSSLHTGPSFFTLHSRGNNHVE